MLVMACACDAPWDGPTTPSGARPISYSTLGNGPPVEHDGVYAATSITALRAMIVNASHRPDPCHPWATAVNMCWENVPDRAGYVYIAVPNPAVCYRTVKDTAAINGHHLYFIFWIGKVQRVCNLALAIPTWRLVSFARSDLPASGTLTVDLQTQEDGQTQDITTQIDLG